jgi:hypothetical protein
LAVEVLPLPTARLVVFLTFLAPALALVGVFDEVLFALVGVLDEVLLALVGVLEVLLALVGVLVDVLLALVGVLDEVLFALVGVLEPVFLVEVVFEVVDFLPTEEVFDEPVFLAVVADLGVFEPVAVLGVLTFLADEGVDGREDVGVFELVFA